MRIRAIVVVLAAASGAGPAARAQDVTVHRGSPPPDACDTRKDLTIEFEGTEGRHLFWEGYSHVSDAPLHVAVRGSRIDLFPRGARLSCTEAGSWKRLSEVVPNDGEEAVTYLGDCTVSVPSKPHTFLIAFTPRYGDVTEEGGTTERKLVRSYGDDGFSERSVSLPKYRVGTYRKLYTSCLRLTVR